MDEELASPVKQVVLTWIQMSSELIFVGRGEELPVLLLHLAQQAMQLPCVLLSNETLNKLPRLTKPPCERIRLRQIVAVVVRGRINRLRLFEVRNRVRDLSGLDI